MTKEQIKILTDSVLPDVTWENESMKKLEGSEHQRGCASMIRACESAIALAEKRIFEGADPLQEFIDMRLWLAKCLYSCNMNNFMEPS